MYIIPILILTLKVNSIIFTVKNRNEDKHIAPGNKFEGIWGGNQTRLDGLYGLYTIPGFVWFVYVSSALSQSLR